MGPERSHTYGIVICAISVITAITFVIGVLRKSYMALALPVTAGFLGALYISFWIGRALVTTVHRALSSLSSSSGAINPAPSSSRRSLRRAS